MWSMMCDVMPTISEDGISQRTNQFGSNSGNGDEANFEQLMVNMLDERDKLMESLRETQEELAELKTKLAEIEKERDSLQRQLVSHMPQEFTSLTRELNQAREQLLEKDEEIQELKAERNNTRLLLEHLECLVSRHERSLRMTVVKRQTQSPAGVSSEVEVLKALKSLFEHHKALDEKVRERLRVTLEKVSILEDELSQSNENLNKSRQIQLQQHQQIESLIEQNDAMKKEITKTVDESKTDEAGNKIDSSVTNSNVEISRIKDLQALIDKQNIEMTATRNRSVELTAKLKDYEDRIVKCDKEIASLKEENIRLSRDMKENIAQKEDQEERIATLEQRYLNAQRESTLIHENNEKIQRELINKEAQLRISQDKLAKMEEESCNRKSKKSKNKQSYLFMGENGKKKSIHESINQDGDMISSDDSDEESNEERKRTFEDRISRLEQQLEEKIGELSRARQREKMNEDHNQRLSATVDKLLAESNERLQLHLKERMSALEDKNTMTQELERVRNLLDETQMEKGKILQEMSKMRIEMENMSSTDHQDVFRQRVSPSSSRFHHPSFINHGSSPISSPLSSETASLSTAKHIESIGSPASVIAASSVAKTAKDNEKDIDRKLSINQTKTNSFSDHKTEKIDVECCSQDTNDSNPFEDIDQQLDQIISSSVAAIQKPHLQLIDHHSSVRPHTDPQTLAIMLQEQLDAINNEIRLIQEEKHSNEHCSEELETQIDSSIDSNINNYIGSSANSREEMPSNPNSGTSTPKSSVQPSPFNINTFTPTSNNRYSNEIDLSYYASPHHLAGYSNPSDWSSNNSFPSNAFQRSPRTNRSIATNPCSSSTKSTHSSAAISNPQTIESRGPQTPIYNQRIINMSNMSDYATIGSPIVNPYSFAQQPNLINSPTGSTLPNVYCNYDYRPIGSATLGSMNPQTKKKSKSSLVGRLFSSSSLSKKSSSSDRLKLQNAMSGGPSSAMLAANTNSFYGSIMNSPSFVSDYGDYVNQGELYANINNSTSSILASPMSSRADFDRRTKKKQELLGEAMKAGTPFALWNGPTIVAWLELWVGMPAWYVAACRANVKSGAIMSALSDTEIQREIGISNPLHRLKLRLAIQEMVALTSPSSAAKPTTTTLAYGEMNHEWIGNEWLPSIGLSQYRSTFMECLVDARMLEHLSKKDIRTHLKMIDAFHRTSLQYGIICLKKLNYDRKLLEERRYNSEHDLIDVLVWSNERLIKWAGSVGLKEYANNLVETGVHGALIALDDSFDANHMAIALQIPPQNVQTRQILINAFNELLIKATERHPNEICASSCASRPMSTLNAIDSDRLV
ncbi:uncharacterized protein NH340_JMT02643 [Sarcoptes scabiei]|nr:uncharacterized protein NH340_JMT02643 [Sarcoptes scabiei]